MMMILIGPNIRRIRLARGMSQRLAAREMGWHSQGSYSDLEMDRGNPTLKTICLLADMLGVPAWVLLLDHPDKVMRYIHGLPLESTRTGSGSRQPESGSNTP